MITKRLSWVLPFITAAAALSPGPAYGVKADDESGAGGCISQGRDGTRDLSGPAVPVYPFTPAANTFIE